MNLAMIELSTALAYGAMFIGFVGVVWSVKTLNTKRNARLFLVISILLMAGGFASQFITSEADVQDARFIRNVRAFHTARAERASVYIAERFPGGTVAYLVDEDSMQDVPDKKTGKLGPSWTRFTMEEMQRRLAENGVTGDEILIVGETKTKVDKAGNETSVQDDPTSAAILKTKLNSIYDKVDIVVNFSGLPEKVGDARNITFLTKKNTATGKNNMLLMTDRGLPYLDLDMIKSGRVAAIIDFIQEGTPDFDIKLNSAPKDLNEAFNLRYFLLTGDSLESFIAQDEYYFISK